MKKQHILFIALIAFTTTLMSCKGKDGEVSLVGPKMSGNITGLVVLVYADGTLLSDKSGVTVSIDGTNMSTTTNSSGAFVLSGVESGIYTITYSKAGYGISKSVKYQFIGGGESYIGLITLCQPPSFYVSNLSVTGTSGLSTILSQSYNTTKTVTFFVGNSSNVSSNTQYYVAATSFTSSYTNGVSGSLSFSTSTYRSWGFQSGQTAYFIAYGLTDGGRTCGYTDVNTGRFVFTNLSATPSNIVSVIVP